MPSPSGYTHIVLYDPATGTTYPMAAADLLDTGGTPRVELGDPFVRGSGDVKYLSRSSALELGLLDVDCLQLKAWHEAETPLCAVGLGLGPIALQWYQATRPSLRMVRTSALGPAHYAVLLESRRRAPAIYQNLDLLEYKGWADTDENGVPEGWTAAGVDTAASSLADGTYSMNVDAGSIGQLYTDVVFPVPGARLTVGAHIDPGAATQVRLYLATRTFAGSTIGQSVTEILYEDDWSVSRTLDEGTYSVRVILRVDTAADATVTTGRPRQTSQIIAPTVQAASSWQTFYYL